MGGIGGIALEGDADPMSTQRMNGVEAMQLRAAADALIGVHPEAVVSLTLTEDGLMQVEVEHPVDYPDEVPELTQITVDVDATVVAGIIPTVDAAELREPRRTGQLSRHINRRHIN
jgi:hypothetical protein